MDTLYYYHYFVSICICKVDSVETMEGKDIESTSRIEEAAIEEKRKKVSMVFQYDRNDEPF